MPLLHHLKRPIAATALATIGVLGVVGAQAAASPPPPSVETCTTPLVLRSIELVRTTHGPAILASGLKPHADTRVALVPEDVVFVQAPDYWNYFIVGCGGTGPVTKVPFTEVLPINGPRGKYGIAIDGRTFDLGNGPAGPATS
jgi:hypothetical protein